MRTFFFISRIAFALTVILAPLRWRLVLEARPTWLIYKEFTDFLLFSSDISLLILLISWGLSLLFERKPMRLGPNFIILPLIGLMLVGLISSFSSLDIELAFYRLFHLIALLLFYLYVVNEIHSPHMIVIPVAAQLVFQSVFAILQFLLQHSVGLQTLGEHVLDPAVSGVSVISNGTTRLLRVYGLTEHPNMLGGCLALGMILLLGVYLYGNKKARKGVVLVLLLGLSAMFFTFSRSAFLAFFAGSGFLAAENIMFRRWDKLITWARLVAAELLLLALLVFPYYEYVGARINIGNSFDKIPLEARSINERRALNEAGMNIFIRYPITGVGLGSVPLAMKKSYPDFSWNFVPPHFVLLVIAMETGALGAIFYLALLILPLVALIKERTNLSNNPRLVTSTALLVAIAVIGLFDIYTWLFTVGRLWHFLALGCWAAAYAEINSKQT